MLPYVLSTQCEYLQLFFNLLRAERADIEFDSGFLRSLSIDRADHDGHYSQQSQPQRSHRHCVVELELLGFVKYLQLSDSLRLLTSRGVGIEPCIIVGTLSARRDLSPGFPLWRYPKKVPRKQPSDPTLRPANLQHPFLNHKPKWAVYSRRRRTAPAPPECAKSPSPRRRSSTTPS